MKYMLDTNICIYIIKHKPQSVIEAFQKINPEDVCISSITYSELRYGIEKSMEKERNTLALMMFLANISILPFTDLDAIEYGEIRADLEKKGLPIGGMDLLIGAHAKRSDLTLITNNTKEFKRIDGLKVMNLY